MKDYLIAFVAVVVLCGAIAGGYFYPKFSYVYTPPAGASAAGSTFGTAKVAAVSMAPATASATTSGSALYNGDANDRIIQDAFVDCNGIGSSNVFLTGGGLSFLTVIMSTSSTAVPSGSANSILTNAQLATTSVELYVSSTTPGKTQGNDWARRWAAGSYLVALFNATNTAACVVGVHYLGT